jgi:hypothetical protein
VLGEVVTVTVGVGVGVGVGGITIVVPGGTPTVIVIKAPSLDLVPGFGACAKILPICSLTTCCNI